MNDDTLFLNFIINVLNVLINEIISNIFVNTGLSHAYGQVYDIVVQSVLAYIKFKAFLKNYITTFVGLTDKERLFYRNQISFVSFVKFGRFSWIQIGLVFDLTGIPILQ